MLQQAIDFKEESDAIHALLESLSDADYARPTLFKDWTINDIIQHLHFFNEMADLSYTDEATFTARYATMRQRRDNGGTLVSVTNDMLDGIKGRDLLALWRDYYEPMAQRWQAADPKQRVVWVGPSMSVRSSMTARLMETWSHAQAIYDLLGVDRPQADRIKNVAVIGINTFGWTFVNRGEDVPDDMPYVRLEAPSGAHWDWGTPATDNLISGSAVEFCQVVTQCRNIADTGLKVVGETANRWMAMAQCFAGPPQDPPAPGTRYRADPSN